MIAKELVVSTARDWVGVPFLHQGRSRNGVDCAGLVIAVANELGLDVIAGYVDRADYPRDPSNDNMMRLLRKHLSIVRSGEPQAGDVLHFSFRILPQHVAIYTGGDNRMVHSFNSGKHQVIENGFVGPWPRRLRTIYRFKGVE